MLGDLWQLWRILETDHSLQSAVSLHKIRLRTPHTVVILTPLLVAAFINHHFLVIIKTISGWLSSGCYSFSGINCNFQCVFERTFQVGNYESVFFVHCNNRFCRQLLNKSESCKWRIQSIFNIKVSEFQGNNHNSLQLSKNFYWTWETRVKEAVVGVATNKLETKLNCVEGNIETFHLASKQTRWERGCWWNLSRK